MKADSERLVKNVGILYVRLAVMMAVSIYSARLVLEYLSVDGFGVFSLIVGFVTITAFLQNAMTIAVQRNISFELGSGTVESRREVFAVSAVIYFALGFILTLVGATVIYWIFCRYAKIPEHLVFQSRVMYFFVLGSAVTNILTVPHSATFIAHEDMFRISAMDIAGNVLKLAAVFAISLFPENSRLIWYGVFLFLISLGILFYYNYASRKSFDECRYFIPKNPAVYKRILAHAWWNTISSFSTVLKLQGSPVLLNFFFGTVANAAYGVAGQINSALTNFVYTISKAVNPQITRKYAEGDFAYVNKLAQWGVRLIFFIIFTLSLPLFVEMHFVLSVWLTQIPQNSEILARLFMVVVLIDGLSNSLTPMMQASGKLSKYTTSVAFVEIMILPVAFVCFKLGAPVYYIMYVSIVSSAALFFVRSGFAARFAHLETGDFVRCVIVRILAYVLFCSPVFAIPMFMPDGVARFVTVGCASVALSVSGFLLILVNGAERRSIMAFVRTKLAGPAQADKSFLD